MASSKRPPFMRAFSWLNGKRAHITEDFLDQADKLDTIGMLKLQNDTKKQIRMHYYRGEPMPDPIPEETHTIVKKEIYLENYNNIVVIVRKYKDLTNEVVEVFEKKKKIKAEIENNESAIKNITRYEKTHNNAYRKDMEKPHKARIIELKEILKETEADYTKKMKKAEAFSVIVTPFLTGMLKQTKDTFQDEELTESRNEKMFNVCMMIMRFTAKLFTASVKGIYAETKNAIEDLAKQENQSTLNNTFSHLSKCCNMMKEALEEAGKKVDPDTIKAKVEAKLGAPYEIYKKICTLVKEGKPFINALNMTNKGKKAQENKAAKLNDAAIKLVAVSIKDVVGAKIDAEFIGYLTEFEQLPAHFEAETVGWWSKKWKSVTDALTILRKGPEQIAVEALRQGQEELEALSKNMKSEADLNVVDIPDELIKAFVKFREHFIEEGKAGNDFADVFSSWKTDSVYKQDLLQTQAIIQLANSKPAHANFVQMSKIMDLEDRMAILQQNVDAFNKEKNEFKKYVKSFQKEMENFQKETYKEKNEFKKYVENFQKATNESIASNKEKVDRTDKDQLNHYCTLDEVVRRLDQNVHYNTRTLEKKIKPILVRERMTTLEELKLEDRRRLARLTEAENRGSA